MIQNGIPREYNGKTVVSFRKGKDVASIAGMQDLPSLYSWMQEAPEKSYKGIMATWDMKTTRQKGILDELITTDAVYKVNGFNGKITWDLPIEEVTGCYLTKDMSNQAYAGIDGDSFKIVLNKEFAPGDVLTYDVLKGQQVSVSDEDPVVAVSEGYEHTVYLVSNDKKLYFHPSYLKKGVEFFKISHNIQGERGDKFSHFNFPDTVGTMSLEFQLGQATGVESYITALADSKSMTWATASSQNYLQKVLEEFGDNDTVVLYDVMQDASGRSVPNPRTARVGAVMEYLTMRELHNLTNTKLMWQAGGTFRSSNGFTKINEGLWRQMRRGTIQTYARKGGITRQHLIDAANYIFRNNPRLLIEDREVTFKAGRMAYDNILLLFADEVRLQQANLGLAGLLGADRNIPNPVGNLGDKMNLSYDLIRFTKVFLPGIGRVTIEHDPSLDYMDQGRDRMANGNHAYGYASTTYTVVVMDVADQRYSNNEQIPQGTKLVEGGKAGKNVYLVKPEGPMTFFGTTNGRYDYRRSGDIVSSLPTLTQTFWAWNVVDILLQDPSRVYMLELEDSAAKGYN